MSAEVGATAPNPDDVASPCISICEISPRWGVCVGCCRTLDEIAVWSLLDAAEKRAVLAELPGRRDVQERAFALARGRADADR